MNLLHIAIFLSEKAISHGLESPWNILQKCVFKPFIAAKHGQ